MSSRNWFYLRCMVITLLGVAALMLLPVSKHRTLHDSWLPSSFNPGREGHLSLYLTLEEEGWPVGRWREPFSRLQDSGQVMILTCSRESRMVTYSSREIELLSQWIGKGNTLFLLGPMQLWPDTQKLLSSLQIPVQQYSSLPDQSLLFSTVSKEEPRISLAYGTTHVTLPGEDPLPPLLPLQAEKILMHGVDTYLIKVPCGQGLVIWCSTPALLSNEWLAQADNLRLVTELIQPSGQIPSRIWFEELHHGFTATYALTRFWENHGLRFALFLILFGSFAYLATSLTRFGKIVPLQQDTSRSTLEFVNSIAELYRRADLRNEVILSLYEETRERLIQRLQLPEQATPDQISDQLTRIHPKLPVWKKLAHRFTSEEYIYGLPPGGWLRVARELIKIKQTLS